MSCNAPLVGERNETVKSSSASSTSASRTTLRTCGPRPRLGRRSFLERWTDVPSTATRAVRSREATCLGYRPGRKTEAYRPVQGVLVAGAVARTVPGLVRAVDRLELLQAPPGADCHAGERALG